MKSYELEKNIVANLIRKRAQYISENTSWFRTVIGSIEDIKDVTAIQKDDDISLKEIFLRDIELTIKVIDKKILNNINLLLENIEIKKIAFSHLIKGGLLKYVFIEPQIKLLDEENALIKIIGKVPGYWKNVQSFFKDYQIYKCDINKYFEYKTLNNIADGVEKSSIVNENTLNILLGKKQIEKVNIDFSIKSQYIKELDLSKQKIFQAAASKNDIILIKGPPGTGKSKTIATLVKHFIFEKKEKVILASRTHGALDNVIDSISITNSSDKYTGIIWEKSSYGDSNSEFIDKDALIVHNMRNRILSFVPKKSHIHKLMKKEFGPRVSIQRFLNFPKNFIHPSLFIGTIASSKLEKRIQKDKYNFNNCILIMDEVSKSTILDVLRYALYAKQIILVGDDMQLGPIFPNKKAIEDFIKILNEKELDIFNQIFKSSVFERLYRKDINKYMFTTTYRSPNYILELYNEFAYDNKIISKVDYVKELYFKHSKGDEKLIKIYSQANKIILNNKNAFHHHNHQMSKFSKENIKEMKILLNHIAFLSRNLINCKEVDIMIMFLYRDQYKSFFRNYNNKIKYWEKRFNSFKFGSVDQMQGNEADIVFVCSTYARENYFLPTSAKFKIQMQDMRRLNVILSRTKNKLIFLINEKVYVNGPIFKDNFKLGYDFSDIFKKFDVKVNINE